MIIKFDSRLKTLRKSQGITQKELAKNLSLDRSTISKYEKGLILPDIKILISIATYFNVSTDYLLGITDIKNKSISMENDYGLMLSQKLSDLGYDITENDIDDLVLACKIILEYKKNRNI